MRQSVLTDSGRKEVAANHICGIEETLSTRCVLLVLLALFLLNVLLRVFYIRYDFVNGDEGVRALTAVRMLEGARLYADVVTDKPPGASLFYAAVFVTLGRSMKAVHAAAIVWNFATSIVVYLIAARFYTKRLGLWAALLFVYFSTNYFTQDTMAANTELLLALPYTAAFYFFIRASNSNSRNPEYGHPILSVTFALFAAGLLTGAAALFKQVGVLNLGFFMLYEILVVWRARGERSLWDSIWRAFVRLAAVGAGFACVMAAFIVWLRSMNALGDFWRNGIVLNMFYIDSEPAGLWLKFMAGRGLGFVLFNATLWSLAALAVWHSTKGVGNAGDSAPHESKQQKALFDRTVVMWGGVTLIAVIMSGRFYGHYFIPALPALSLLGARGAELLQRALGDPDRRRSSQIGIAVLSLFFLVGLFRCHHRTAVLAYETVTGTRTHWSANWGMTKREQEAEVVSNFVRGQLSAGEPLYIWGYAHDVFWRTGCRPASRYLTPYFIDGRFADAEATVSSSGEQFRTEAAANLLEDLQRARPRLILDVEGTFTALPYPELMEFINANYVEDGSAGLDPSRPFRALRAKVETDKTEARQGKVEWARKLLDSLILFPTDRIRPSENLAKRKTKGDGHRLVSPLGSDEGNGRAGQTSARRFRQRSS
jgi:4-amino-4-deoxy-L-arabinose transferase-like glycosyltransferase